MKEKDLEKIKKNENLVLVPLTSADWIKSLEYMFGNSIVLPTEYTDENISRFVSLVNKKQISRLIIVDYAEAYRDIVPFISSKVDILWIMTYSVASLTDGAVRNVFRNMMEYYDRDLVSKMGVFDNGLYLSLKKAKYPVFHILPDFIYEQKEPGDSKSLAIISDDYNANHGYYNMLSALKLTSYDSVKVNYSMPATENFINDFQLKTVLVNDLYDLRTNNEINLYVNFTNTKSCLILESMDNGIPCLVGNTDLFDSSVYLKKMLVLESDDDVNEIAFKINEIRKNKEEIISKYRIFRNNYSKIAKEKYERFLED